MKADVTANTHVGDADASQHGDMPDAGLRVFDPGWFAQRSTESYPTIYEPNHHVQGGNPPPVILSQNTPDMRSVKDVLMEHAQRLSEKSPAAGNAELKALLSKHARQTSDTPQMKGLDISAIMTGIEHLPEAKPIILKLQLSDPDIGRLKALVGSGVTLAYDGNMGMIVMRGTREALEGAAKAIYFIADINRLKGFWIKAEVIADDNRPIGEWLTASSGTDWSLASRNIHMQYNSASKEYSIVPSQSSNGVAQLGELSDPITLATSHVTINVQPVITLPVSNTPTVLEILEPPLVQQDDSRLLRVEMAPEPVIPVVPPEPVVPVTNEPEPIPLPVPAPSSGGGAPAPAAPENTVPAAQTTTVSTTLNVAGLAVTDSDDTSLTSVTFSVVSGTITLNETVAGGVTAGDIAGNNTGTVTINNATIAAINAMLADAAGLGYTPNTGFTGADTFTMLSNDGTATDSDDVTITVNPLPVLSASLVDDLPSTTGNAVYSGAFADWHSGDSIYGGAGSDELQISGGPVAVTLDGATFTNIQEIETLKLEDGAHDIAVSDHYFGRGDGLANDTFIINASAATAGVTFDGTGTVAPHAFSVTGGSGDDSFTGGAGNDTFAGGSGIDSIHGGAGNDRITIDWTPATPDQVQGSSLQLWLDANDRSSITLTGNQVTNWADKGLAGAGNGANDATPDNGNLTLAPVYTQALNGLQSLYFDGANDVMRVLDAANLDNTSGLTIITVVTPTHLDGSPDAIISKRIGANNQQSYSSFFYTGNRLSTDMIDSGNRFQTNTVFAEDQPYLIVTTYDGTAAAAQRVRIDVNGTLDRLANEGSATIPNYSGNLYIGALNSAYGQYMTGHIQEIMVYNDNLDLTDRQSIERYIGNKYGLAVDAAVPNVFDSVTGGAGVDRLTVSSGKMELTLTGTSTIQEIEYFDFAGNDAAHVIGLQDSYYTSGDGVQGDVVTLDFTGNTTGIIASASALTGSHAVNILGSDGLDVLNGGAADDTISGAAGNDEISAGGGNDRILGGMGMDCITGGLGDDVFVFNTAADSPAGTADRITDFRNGGANDTIELSAILGGAGAFIGNAAFSGAQEIRYDQAGAHTMVQIDTDSDGTADMEIQLDDFVGAGLMAGHFIF